MCVDPDSFAVGETLNPRCAKEGVVTHLLRTDSLDYINHDATAHAGEQQSLDAQHNLVSTRFVHRDQNPFTIGGTKCLVRPEHISQFAVHAPSGLEALLVIPNVATELRVIHFKWPQIEYKVGTWSQAELAWKYLICGCIAPSLL
jgi:hypothetical protein